MPQSVENAELFHVTRRLPYNPHLEPLPGSTISTGTAHNPFFAFYESARTLPVQQPDGSISQAHLIHWMECIATGQFVDADAGRKAVDIVKHFQMLSRELGLELVRREIAVDAPSRMTCLWTTEDRDQAKFWADKLGGGRVLRLRATGMIHKADASLMAGDSVSYREVVANAHRYWRGEEGDHPEPEVLFSGTADIIEFLGER